MHDFLIVWDWLEFAARWLHVITAIAWIGSSFYFIALDLGLRKTPSLPKLAHGEEWQVHGGGFYHINKYLVAPEAMPEHLTWFKWEAYSTWLSGFALMCIVYYAGADLYLIDPGAWNVSTPIAIMASIASIALAWIAYDLLCKSKLGENPTLLMILLYVIIVALAYGYTQIFTGRASLLHLGAITATVMSGNVFFVIMPNQRIVVADLKAGRTPDPKYGKIAKLRSTHNNYLTLPVIFLMLSNHYPLAYATEYNWAIASIVFLMGVTIRHYFNSIHARNGNPTWTWPVTAILFLIIVWLSSLAPIPSEDETALRPSEAKFASSESFEDITHLITGRCSMCHAAEPGWDNMVAPPKGVMLETPQQIARQAREIYLHSGRSNAMPPPSVAEFGIELTLEERQMINAWFESAS